MKREARTTILNAFKKTNEEAGHGEAEEEDEQVNTTIKSGFQGTDSLIEEHGVGPAEAETPPRDLIIAKSAPKIMEKASRTSSPV
jgi:hypothetical protein